ncbi:hypothetical protein [Marimonas arenosa]|uniref:Transglutaminase superfamily protein n=1 Tax=Marimonas arenosa TaxID=1795305 RepID=A0AAE3WDH6_9RHOB|nr:hypothetical protein [Marimonas arenosa]MDQ2089623.1 hypothetical protein [Marimonas arenosa]
MRAFLEPHWAVWHARTGSPEGRRTLSEGTCGRSSRFLCEVLRRDGFEAELVFGSPVECDCGFRTEAGWKGHGWVLVREPARIVDLTADQFGAAPVIVTGIDDPRYRAGHDIAGPGWIAERQRVARTLLRAWDARGLASEGKSTSSDPAKLRKGGGRCGWKEKPQS